MKKLFPFALCFIVSLPAFISAQTAAELEDILDSPAVTCAQAAWFTLASGPGNYDLTGGSEGAFKTAREKGWLPRKAAADDPVSLGSLSFLIMQAFDIKGGLMYTLLPGKRYAFRTMVSRSLIQGAADPAMTVSGERFLLILGRVLSYRGDEVVPEPAENAEAAVEAAAAVVPEPPEEQREQQERREQMVREIRTELEARSVADTTVRVVEEGVAISLNNIRFMPDDTELTEPERMKLMRIAVILNRYSGRKILVGGHTAQAGTAEGRQLISTRRAQAVADFLIFLDSRRPEDIIVRGYGAERPLGTGETAEGQALNRRVEITILDE